VGRITGRGGSYGHRIQVMGGGDYLLHWVVDYRRKGSRLRYPHSFKSWADERGARRFARRWGLTMPGQLGL
jgi:hypothetical protein